MRMEQEPYMSPLLRPALRLRSLLIDYDFEFSEVLNALAATLWGFWLMLPMDSFGSTRSFAAMRDLADESIWGAGICAVGLVELIGLITERWQWRRRSALLLCGLWAFVAVMLARANFAGTGTVIYPLLSLSALWAFLRMRFR